ncbi:M24 family metallopeptidase [Lyticum sinuosum]|uniref:Aminopeptidase P family protein n=1 Tax=Lyticum sinuosum TaxID=1332059 RepID=A0AAE4VKD8_9RICK|nr:M24 family metallopeptidase [Lyticum sinuosum]MDZ5761135.1 Aminopeptidase P family protein [Lyticum sinuosum]
MNRINIEDIESNNSIIILKNHFNKKNSYFEENNVIFNNFYKKFLFYKKNNNLDGYIIPSWDEWSNLNINNLKFISGFTGSNGIALIFCDNSNISNIDYSKDIEKFDIINHFNIFITDSRYLTQVNHELFGNWLVIDIKDKKIIQNLLKLLKIKKLGCDPFLCNEKLELLFENIDIVDIPFEKSSNQSDLLNLPWIINTNIAGENSLNKLDFLINLMPQWADSALISDVSFISWLLNIRGSDIDYSGIVLSYLIINKYKRHYLYINKNIYNFLKKNEINTLFINNIQESNIKSISSDKKLKIKEKYIDKEYFDILKIDIYPLEEIYDLSIDKVITLFDKKTLTRGFYQNSYLLKDDKKNKQKKHDSDIFYYKLTKRKAIKNIDEINGFIDAHLIDGIAVTKFINWVNSLIDKNDIALVDLDELNAVKKLLEFRIETSCGTFAGSSFKTIMAFAENGAIIHYTPNEKTNKIILKKGHKCLHNILLIDSGAHYYSSNYLKYNRSILKSITNKYKNNKKYKLNNKNTFRPNGTTDVTRTIAIGNPTLEQKIYFTAVLRCHIAAASTKFKYGTNGKEIDSITRKFLHEIGEDYSHGTGHGVGHILNVHEGPHSISIYGEEVLEDGMIVSIEPGLYLKNKYGIRIENLYVIKKCKYNNMLKFKCLTIVPIDEKMIIKENLTKTDCIWLKKYKKICRKSFI